MKKVVIIDFDEQYINTSIIVYNGIRKALFSHKGVDSPKITLSDVEEVINLNLEGIINYLSKKYDSDLSNPSILKMLELYCEDYFTYRGILSDGLQEFLQECEKREIKVYVITNKPLDSVKHCIDTFTKFLVKNVYECVDSNDEIEVVKKILKEEQVRSEEMLFISSNDFGKNGINHYTYSKHHCGDYFVSNMLELVDVLDDKSLSHPYLSCNVISSISLDKFKKYYEELKMILNKDFIPYDFNKNEIVITINKIKMTCYQNNSKSMYLDQIVKDLLEPFVSKKDELKELFKKYKSSNTLEVSVHLLDSKINPTISINKENRKLIDYLDIDLDYDLFIE